MFTLSSPFWLLLIPLWLGHLWLALERRGGEETGRSRITLAHPDLAPMLGSEEAPKPGSSLTDWLNGFAILLLIVALARPQWVGDWIPETPEGREMALLIDTSRTMSIADFELNGAPIERLDVLKGIVGRFVEARPGDQFGVIAFGSIAATLVPPTFDRDLVTAVLKRVRAGIAGDDTAIGDAIGLALKQLRERASLRPVLILFTDGDSTAGDISPREAVELARRMKVPVYTVQIGSDLFGRPDGAAIADSAEPGLKEIAALTGGRYYQAGSTVALRDVIRDIGQLEKTVARSSARRVTEEWYLLPLLAAAALFTIGRLIQIRRMAS